MKKFTVAIIGGGPGGYVTAIRLKQYGIEAVVFEKERLGGVCLNKGCIPTKAMVKMSDLFKEIKESAQFGILTENPTLDYSAVLKRRENVVDKLVSGIEFLFKKHKIEAIYEEVIEIEKKAGHFIINTAENSYETDFTVMATGSVPKELPDLKADGHFIMSSDDLLALKTLPGSLAVIGGGVIGCEFASVMSNFGVKTEIIEFLPNLLPYEDEEIAKKIQLALKKRKIALHLGTAVKDYTIKDNKVELCLSNTKIIAVDKVLLSVGRKPFCTIRFKNFEVKRENEAFVIQNNMLTSEDRLYAIGDLTGKLMLAHTASKQGLLAAEHIKNVVEKKPSASAGLEYLDIPRCTFTDPEVASVGLTEKQALEKYGSIITGRFPFSANGKALGMGNSFGLVKTIAEEKTKKIIGMHIIGPNASELIAQGGIIVGSNMSLEETKKIVFAHPTLSEVVMESLEALEGLSVHSV